MRRQGPFEVATPIITFPMEVITESTEKEKNYSPIKWSNVLQLKQTIRHNSSIITRKQ